MAVDVDKLRIVHYPDPVLRRKADPVGAITPEVRSVAARMVELMHEADGVGLAAPQVGLSWRLFVANWTGQRGEGHDWVFIDPQLVEPGRQVGLHQEGCLSLPDIRAEITRPLSITIHATGLDGKRFTLTGSGLDARVWQHEFDHLEGTLILDRMTRVDKLANRRKIKELEGE